MGFVQVVPVVMLDSIGSRTVSGVITSSTRVVLDNIVCNSVSGVCTGCTSGCTGQYCQYSCKWGLYRQHQGLSWTLLSVIL